MHTTSSPALPLPFDRPQSRSRFEVDAAAQPRRRLLATVWETLKEVGARRGRRGLLALAREQQAIRPELAASLRAAARRSWL